MRLIPSPSISSSSTLLLLALLLSAALLFVALSNPTPAIAQTPVNIDRAALVALYNATGGPDWIDKENFLNYDVPLSEWQGVTVNENGRVTELELWSNNLVGTIPAELANLTQLQVLYLQDNELNGEIPAQLGNLTQLQELDLAENQLTGSIPSALGNLSSLTVLDLDTNQLSGSLPSELGNLSSLRKLAISENGLSGSIPVELGNLSNLAELYLWGNEFSGAIPSELGSLSNLTELSLQDNQLTGAIPPELGNLSSLSDLGLWRNQLTGEIPTELGNLSSLIRLELGRNQLSGEIPAQMGNLSSLELFSVSGNQLSGRIPSELGSLSNLTQLYLRENRLSGEIPSTLGNLSNLTELYIHDNQLTGTIPLTFTGLTSLEEFHFDNNAGLCASDDTALQTWLQSIPDRDDGPNCDTSAPATISYVFQNFHVISQNLDEYGDHDAECKSRLGNQYRLADWNDLTSWVAAGGSTTELIAGLRLSWEGLGTHPSIYPHDGNGIDVRPRVSWNGNERWNDGRRHFFISRQDHVRPGYFLTHDDIDNYHISLGSWYGVGGTVLCYDTATPASGRIAFAHNPAQDFDTLIAAGNAVPEGIWSDGTTAWVSDVIDQKIYAYNLATKQRDSAKDFDTLAAAGNRYPHGIWSDGTTMWVAHNTNHIRSENSKLYAYDLATKQRASAKDINALEAAGNGRPDGIWSDGTTMWVADWDDSKLYAYNLATKQRDSAKDFDTLAAAGNNNPDGIWSDGTTVWVSDLIDQKIYAYNMATKQRDSAKDFDTLAAAGNNNPADMWSDGTTLWVTDWGDGKIYAYNMPQPATTPQPDNKCQTALTGDDSIDASWTSDCDSQNSEGSYARYYTFTLDQQSEVTITLESSEDTYMFLLRGAGRDGEILCENDDYTTQVGGAPCDIIDSALDSTLDSAIVANLHAGDYTIEATTYNANTTGEFTLKVSGIDATTPPPPESPFKLVVEKFPTHAEVGQPFTLTVRMHDVQQAGEHGGISVSFPSLEDNDHRSGNSYTSSVADVEEVNEETTVSNVNFFRNDGSKNIHHASDNEKIQAKYLLVESDEPWAQGDARRLTLRITPNQIPANGEFPILVRGWICADTTAEGEYTNCARSPSPDETTGTDTDQQGHLARKLTVTVIEAPELHARLKSCGVGDRDPHRGHYQPDDTVRLSARVTNESAGISSANLYTLFQFFGSDGSEIGRLKSRTTNIPKNANYVYEFAQTVEAGSSYLPEGINTVVCTLLWDNRGDHRFQDYTGGRGPINNATITVSDTPSEAIRLINNEPIEGTQATLSMSINPPTDGHAELRTLTITLEAQNDVDKNPLSFRYDYGLDDTSFLEITVPETAWIDYQGLEKWVSSYDGLFVRYTPERETKEYQSLAGQDAISSVILSIVPFGIGSFVSVISDFFADLSDIDLDYGLNSNNCSDTLIVTTLIPWPADPGSSNTDRGYTKRLQIEVPVVLNDNDYISLKSGVVTRYYTARHPGDPHLGILDAYDLLTTGRGVPTCQRP